MLKKLLRIIAALAALCGRNDHPAPEQRLAWLRRKLGDWVPDIYAGGAKYNGAGPEGCPWLAELIPDDLPWLPCLDAVWDWHDYSYGQGGGERERLAADLSVLYLMREAAKDSFRWRNPTSWLRVIVINEVAAGYFDALHAAGHNFFNYSKPEAVQQ